MPTYFQRPENALKRANEFIDVGKKQRALDALYDVIKSKRHKTWQMIHEPIMEKYLELCVDLKKSHIAKEGLYQYKLICLHVNTKSLEDVVKRFLSLAEERTDNARKESHQLVEVDDLDVLQTPESVLLSAVSGEDSQDRSDRAILTPWLRFLWDSYRQCLELLKNNPTLEKLYQDVAQNAFKFCLKYNRKTEFRKLCENLRTHLELIQKNQNQPRSINLNNPESQHMHLETRLAQLDSAIQMESWQEAYKAVEDIHCLITISKKQPKPSLRENYYKKLALVLYKSGNYLFHAATWHRLYHLYRDQRKNMTESDLQRIASRVLCATLAIPIPSVRNQCDHIIEVDDNGLEKHKKLSSLLFLANPPSRASLVKDLQKYGILQYVYPELSNFYNLLEIEFQPLSLPKQAVSFLDFISKTEDLSQYISSLREVIIIRYVKQISQIYESISLNHFQEMVPFADKFMLEKVLVGCAKNMDLQVKINHKEGSINFGSEFDIGHEEICEGPHLPNQASDRIRTQLMMIAKAMEKSISIICPREIQESRDMLRHQIFQNYKQSCKNDHQMMLKRKQMIEDRKEYIEFLNNQREKEEQEQAEEQRRKQYEAEMARLSKEAEEREKQRRLDEHRDIQKRYMKEKLDQMKSTSIGAKALANLTEDALETMDMDDILAKQVEQLEKEKKEREEKLKAQEKKIDYFERAKCLEQIPLVQKKFEQDQVAWKNYWEETEQERITDLIKEREMAISQKNRLLRMKPDQEAFLAKLKSARHNVYKEKLKEFEKDFNEEKKKALQLRREKRKEERRNNWIKEKDEERIRKEEELQKRIKEEEEQRQKQKREQELKEYQERKKKLDEIEEKKRQREREIEAKRNQKAEEAKASVQAPPSERIKRDDGPWRGGRDDRREDNFKRDWKRDDDGGKRDMRRDDDWKKEPRREIDEGRRDFRDLRKDDEDRRRDWRKNDDDRRGYRKDDEDKRRDFRRFDDDDRRREPQRRVDDSRRGAEWKRDGGKKEDFSRKDGENWRSQRNDDNRDTGNWRSVQR